MGYIHTFKEGPDAGAVNSGNPLPIATPQVNGGAGTLGVVTLNGTSKVIVPANPNRTGLIITSDNGAADVCLAVGKVAILGQGIFLIKTNGIFQLFRAGLFSTEKVEGITDGNNTNVTFQEFV